MLTQWKSESSTSKFSRESCSFQKRENEMEENLTNLLLEKFSAFAQTATFFCQSWDFSEWHLSFNSQNLREITESYILVKRVFNQRGLILSFLFSINKGQLYKLKKAYQNKKEIDYLGCEEHLRWFPKRISNISLFWKDLNCNQLSNWEKKPSTNFL